MKTSSIKNSIKIKQTLRLIPFLLSLSPLAYSGNDPVAKAGQTIQVNLTDKTTQEVKNFFSNKDILQNTNGVKISSTQLGDEAFLAVLPTELKYINVIRKRTIDKTTRTIEDMNSIYDNFKGYQHIASLSRFTNLTELYLHYTRLTDISSLAFLTNLTSLVLQTDASDISALASLTNLTSLVLQTSANDLSALSNLTNLTSLYLQTNASDLSALAHLTNLTQLHLSGPHLANIASLTHLTSLTRLHLDSPDIADISLLTQLTHLNGLYLGIPNDLGLGQIMAFNRALPHCVVDLLWD